MYEPIRSFNKIKMTLIMQRSLPFFPVAFTNSNLHTLHVQLQSLIPISKQSLDNIHTLAMQHESVEECINSLSVSVEADK